MAEPGNSGPFPITTISDPNRRQVLAAAFPQVDAVFRAFAEQRHIPGLAYGIVIDGELAHTMAIGSRNVVDQTPVTPDSIFRIASMSKSFAAMAIMKLRDEGKLRLDDPAENYVPELTALSYPTQDSARILVRDLLTMGAGLPQDDPWADRQLSASEDQVSEMLRRRISFSN